MVVTAIFVHQCLNEFVIASPCCATGRGYTLPIQVFSLVAGRYTVNGTM
jgi:multiple sugar transport system permease protein